MQPFSAAELAAMQSAQVVAMQDTCYISAYSATTNAYGEEVATYTAGASQACGVDMRGGREVHASDNTTVTTDATVRLPVGTVVDMRDRVTVTHRFGVAVTPIVYEIVGPIRRGPSGVRLDLQRIVL